MGTIAVATSDGRGFWAEKLSFSIWFAYLVDELERTPDDPWTAQLADEWRLQVTLVIGVRIPTGAPSQLAALLSAAHAARRHAADAGDVPLAWIVQWPLPEHGPMGGGGGPVQWLRDEPVPVAGVLEIGDAFIGLLDGTLPSDPPEGAWFVGTGSGAQVLKYIEEGFDPSRPRFRVRPDDS